MTDRHKFDDPLAGPLARTLAAGLDRSGRECPEAETLAQYFDRALPTGETAHWELHFSACSRCQEQLAAMARMESAGAPAAQPRGTSISWLWNWRWLAPAAAALGAVAIWVVLNNTGTPTSSVESVVTQQAPVSPSPQAGPPQVAVGPDRVADLQANQNATAQPGRSTSDAAPPEAGSKRQQTLAGKVQDLGRVDALRAPKPAAPEVISVQPAEGVFRDKKDAPANEFAIRAEPEKAKEEKTIERETKVAEVATLAARPAPAEARALESKQQAAAPAPSVEQDSQAARDEFNKRAPEAAVQAKRRSVVGMEQAPNTVKRARRANESNASSRFVAVSVAGSNLVWRFGPAGSIELSTDSSASWQRQSSGVTTDLLAGSAPSATVCWAVGRGGVVLRTTDGSTWAPMGSPTSADLVAIEARDALQATVTTADGKRYSTSDGGRTWRSL